MIIVDNVSTAGDHAQPTCLKNISMRIKPKEFLWITGDNNSGKSALLSLLALHVKPYTGTISLLDQDINHSTKRGTLTALRRHIGYVPQETDLIAHDTLVDNVALPLRLQGTPYDVLKKEIFDLLQWFSLEDKASCLVENLSASERQRASIARAVIHRPKLLIADEPFSTLDDKTREHSLKIFTLLHQIGTTIILATTQKDGLKGAPAGRTHIMKDGRLRKNGETT